jgi:DNA-binding MarR family transcriptional regulator
MEKETFEHYKWIFRGKQRKAILRFLDKAKTPTQLKEETDIKVTNVSDVLRAMLKRKLVKCLNPNDKLCRFYRLTALGEKIRKEFV